MLIFIGVEGVLSFRAGERLQILNAHKDDWLEGTARGVIGFFPSGYVELIPVQAPTMRPATVPSAGVPQPAPTNTPPPVVAPAQQQYQVA